MAAGDAVVLALFAVLLALSFATWGLVTHGAKGITCAACGVMLAWAIGRLGWSGLQPGEPRAWGVAAMAALWPALWLGFQALPLPHGLLGADRLAQWQALADAGIALPDRLPLALTPFRATESATLALAYGGAFLGALALARHRRNARRLAVLLVFFLAAEGLVGVLDLREPAAGRARGSLFNPNHFAARIFLLVPLAVALAVDALTHMDTDGEAGWRSRGTPWLLLAPPVLGILAGVRSGSRAGIAIGLGLLAAWALCEGIAWAWRGRRHHDGSLARRSLIVAGGAAGAVIAAKVLALFEDAAKRSSSGVADIGERLSYWQATLAGWREFPWLGLGGGGVEAALLQHTTGIAEMAPVFSHNDFAQVLAEWGVLGAGAWVILAGLAGVLWLRTFGVRASIVQRGAVVGILSALSHAAFDFHLRLPGVALPFVTMLALALGPGTANAFPHHASRS
jgi:hypothetical protein